MKKTILNLTYLSLFFFCFSAHSQSSIWKTLQNNQIHQDKTPGTEILYFEFSHDVFSQKTSKAPDRFKTARSQSEITLPKTDGGFETFQIFEATNFHKELSNKYPTIKSYVARSINSNKTARISYEPSYGFYAHIYQPKKPTLIIKPENKQNNIYKLYSIADLEEEFSDFECNTVQQSATDFGSNNGLSSRNADDSNLRQYRVAVSTTGEYAQFFLDGSEVDDAERITKVLAAINVSLDRINGIFERDFSVTMVLVADNDEVIYLNPSTDPYNGPDNQLLQNTLDSNIGDANYDVGHLFAFEGSIYGNAGCIACVCTSGSKGSGFTVHSAPDSDNFNMIASHEFGHQFGGWHVQSSSLCRSANGLNEVEPGSGSTIMGYAGICPPNVQSAPDDYFNFVNIRDIAQWTINDSSCAQIIPILNSPPTADAGADYTIPISTAFILEGSASDPDTSDVLSFSWEQNDPENPFSSSTPSPTRFNGPMFRSRLPADVPYRYMPQISDIVSGNLLPTWEVLPSVTRDLTFEFTVRDNALGGGQTATDEIIVSVDANFGPFRVTSQATPESWNVGEPALITWDVANTTNAPISAANVDILLSIDGGFTYPYNISTTANDGSESVLIPSIPTTSTARVMVRASNNIFFAINPTDIEIQASEFLMNFDDVDLSVCKPNDAVYTFTYNTFLGFDEVTTFSTENLPEGATASFDPSTANTDDTTVQLTISNTSEIALGSYDFIVKGTSASADKTSSLTLNVYDTTLIEPSLINPSDNETGVSINETLEWQDDINAENYEVEVALDNTFSNLVETAVVTNNSYVVNNLNYDTTYYWHVRSINECLTSSYSETYTFSTLCLPPSNLAVSNVSLSSADISWDAGATETQWELEYGLAGFTQGTGTVIETSDNPYTLTGLELSTTYDVYLRAICSTTSEDDDTGWTGPVSFSTLGLSTPINLVASINQQNGEVTLNWGEPAGIVGEWILYYDFTCTETYFDIPIVFYDDFTFDHPTISESGTWELVGDQITWTYEENGFQYYGTFEGNYMSGTNDGDGCWYADRVINDDVSYTMDFTVPEVLSHGEQATNPGEVCTYTFSENNTQLELAVSQDFLNYNIYRDDVLLGTAEETTYTDLLSAYGTYDYHVTALYNQGESNSSNIASVVYEGVPDISVNPTALFETLQEGETSTQVLTISNSGDGPLNFDISSTVIDGFGYGEPVVTTMADDATYVMENSLDNESYSPGFSKRTRSYAVSSVENVLVLENTASNFYAYEQALINLNLPYTFVTDWNTFFNELTGGTDWDMVILNSYGSAGDTFIYSAIDDYVNTGGLLIFAHWNLASFSSHPLLSSMGVDYVANIFTPLSINPVSSSQVIFNTPNPISALLPTDDQFNVDGQIVDVISNAQQVAYLGSNTSSGAIVINQNGTSIFNSFQSENFQADANANGKDDITELIENEISYLLGANWLSANPSSGTVASGSSIDINVTFDATNLTAGIYNATLDISSNDPDESLLAVPAELTVIPPSCPKPTNFTALNVSNQSVDLSWTPGGAESQWEIEYGLAGFTQGTGTVEQTSTNPYVITGLDSTTSYDVYLRANCGDNPGDDDSIWVGPVSFTTTADYCGGDNFYDSGGPDGNYSNNEDVVTTIYPSDGFNSVTAIFNSFELEGCCDFLRIYDGVDTNAPLLGSFNGTVNPGSFSSSNPDGALTFYFTSDSSVTRSGWDVSIICESITCPNPSDLNVNNISEDSAELSWTPGGSESQWEIEYGLAGFAQGTGTVEQTSTNPYVITGLDTSTAYDVYLRANCGANPGDDDSGWVGPVSFTTSADYCGGDNFYDSGGPDGNYSNNEDEVTTIYPSEGFDYITAIFNSFELEGCCDFLRIYDGVDTNAPLLGIFNGTVNPGSFTSSNPDGALTFYFTSDSSVTRSGWDVSIICESITCPNPLDFNVDNISEDSAELSWTPDGTESQWEIEYGLAGFIQGTGTVEQTSTNPYVITGLNTSTAYDVYLRANCGANPGDDDSIWVGPISFETTCAAVLAPFSENFPTFNAPNCWRQYGSEPWIFNTFADYTASTAGDHTPSGNTNYAWIDGSAPTGPGQISNLRTVPIDVSQLTEPALQFSIFSENLDDGTYNTLDVVVHNGANETETVLNLQGSTGGWLTYTFLLDGITANSNIIEIEFIIEENSPGNAHFNDILVDDIFVDNFEVLGASNFTLEELIVYPNPVKNELYVEYIETIDRIELYSLLGQKLLEVEPNQTTYKLNTSEIAAATYMLRVVSGESSKMIKVIKF